MPTQRLLQPDPAAATDPGTASAAPPLLNLMIGAWVSQAISVVAKLGIADLLENGPRSSRDLAQAVGVHSGALYRLLRALASVGVFAETEAGRFELTPMAAALRTRAQDSLRDYAILLGENWNWRAWGELRHSVATGESALQHVMGMPVFDYFARHEEAGCVFDAAMTSRGNSENRAVAQAYDFSSRTIVDVGGGRGSLLATILEQNPASFGIVLDLPHVKVGAEQVIHEARLGDRCRFMSGDFFQQVPAAGDIYLLKKVIHDWDDARSQVILAHCRAAMTDGARLLMLKHVIAPGNGPAIGKLSDLQMLVHTPGGRERSKAEYTALLAGASFKLARIIPTGCTLSIIEALPC